MGSHAIYRPKQLPDGKVLVNLGCGTRMHASWNNIDFSIYARFRRRMGLVRAAAGLGLISQARLAQFSLVEPDIIVWNFARGIPFADNTVDGLYHSHLLEHLDREDALTFLRECRRVLRRGGVIRIAVPDLEKWARTYLESLSEPVPNPITKHEAIIEDLLVQMVQREPTTRKSQKQIVRLLERVALGDGRRVGWQHRWMYDRVTLTSLVKSAGFSDCRIVGPAESRIPGWNTFRLESEPDGSEYKPESVRVEAVSE